MRRQTYAAGSGSGIRVRRKVFACVRKMLREATLAMLIHGIIFGVMLLVVFAPLLFITMHQHFDYKQRKKKYEEERAIQNTMFRREIDAILQRAVIQQRQDDSVISVPVTTCEKRDRRRILKLEN